jgi:hypothetical protein
MASASGRQAGLGLGAGAAGTVPPALLLLVPQIIAAGGDENIALLTIESAWDGTLNIITCGRIIPLADAIQRSTAILEEALPVFISRSSRIHQGQGWGSDVMMRYTARLAIGVSQSPRFKVSFIAHKTQTHINIGLFLLIAYMSLEAEATGFRRAWLCPLPSHLSGASLACRCMGAWTTP